MTYRRTPSSNIITPPLASNFTLFQTGSNGSLVDDAGTLYFSATQRIATEDSILAAQNNPGGTGAAYTLTVGFIPIPGGRNGVGGIYSYHITGIAIYNTTTNELRNLTFYTDSSGALHLQFANKSTSLTTAGAATFDIAGYPFTTGSINWLRVQDDGTTNRIWSTSNDGKHFKIMATEARTVGFTSQPNRIGIYLNPYNADAQMTVVSYQLTSP